MDPDAPNLAGGPATYQEYVAHGVFAAHGRRTQGQASSLDDHYIGMFGDDWGSGREPAYSIGPSGTDEEHYAELYQYRRWLTARGLRVLEAGGQKATICHPSSGNTSTPPSTRYHRSRRITRCPPPGGGPVSVG